MNPQGARATSDPQTDAPADVIETLTKKLGTLGDTEVQERLSFLELTADQQKVLADGWPLLEPHLGSVLDGFYQHLTGYDVPMALIGDEARIDGLKSAQRSHWEKLFKGPASRQYIEDARLIGAVHFRIGLTQQWYMGAYCFALNRLTQVVNDKVRLRAGAKARLIQALNSAVFLDMDIALSVYNDLQNAELDEALARRRVLTEAFEGTVGEKLAVVYQAMDELEDTADGMAESAAETSGQSQLVAQAASDAAASTDTVAASVDDMSQSVREISEQVDRSAGIAENASTEAEQVSGLVGGLAEAAQTIGDVVQMIKDIADQTNLLALNATIEAARAGDAGKGFAVVASEVKTLANQTAKATGDIAEQVDGIRSATDGAVRGIEGISATVAELNDVTAQIAAAVNEQNTVTDGIADSTQAAAGGVQQVSSNIADVQKAVENTALASSEVLGATARVQMEAGDLRDVVTKFVEDLTSG